MENPLKDYIKEIIKNSSVDQSVISEVLGCKSVAVFRNKLSLGRFNLQEIAVIVDMCGYDLSIVRKDDSEKYILHPEQICSKDTVERLSTFRVNRLNERKELFKDMSDEEIKIMLADRKLL